MGKKIIIKGADFSVNGISGSSFFVGVNQGALNASDAGHIGAIQPTGNAVYPIRVNFSRTVAVPVGKTVSFSETSSQTILCSALLVFNIPITFPQATSSQNNTYVPNCISGGPLSDMPELNNYTYTNNSSNTVYIALDLRNQEGTAISPSAVGEIEVTIA